MPHSSIAHTCFPFLSSPLSFSFVFPVYFRLSIVPSLYIVYLSCVFADLDHMVSTDCSVLCGSFYRKIAFFINVMCQGTHTHTHSHKSDMLDKNVN